ncbi:MAG: WD40 repeat domain-containing protein [Planctomycetes bacterium]|nr:WD40 repeat domain-containing protein [Planctomycetota bacterium]
MSISLYRFAAAALRLAAPMLTAALGAQTPEDRVDFAEPDRHTGYRSWAFAANGKWVAGGTGRLLDEDLGGELIVWDARKGTILRNLGRHGAHVDFVCFAAEDRLLVSACTDELDDGFASAPRVRVWDARSGKQRRDLRPGVPATLPPRVTGDGRSLAWVGKPHADSGPQARLRLEVWDLTNGERRWQLDDCAARSFDVAPDGSVLVAWFQKATVPPADGAGQPAVPELHQGLVAWRLASGEEAWRVPLDDDDAFGPLHVTFLPGGEQFAVLRDGALHLHAAADGRRLRSLQLEGLTASGDFAFDEDRRRLACTDTFDDQLSVWDLSSGERVLRWTAEGRNGYGRVCFSRQLDRVAGLVPAASPPELGPTPPGLLRLRLP